MSSRRNYLSQSELEEYANINVLDSGEADDQISQAEEIIDSFVGPQVKFFGRTIFGRASAGASQSLTLQANQITSQTSADYYKFCEVEIVGGTGEGQRRVITSSSVAGVLTVASAWTTPPDSTSFYKIYQLGKFPRHQDVRYYTDTTPYTYIKSIPEAIKRATAAQVEFMINMGDKFFGTDQSNKVSERIGDYSYTNSEAISGSTGVAKLIAPKSKLLLRGIKKITGEITL